MFKKIIKRLLCVHDYEPLYKYPRIALERGYFSYKEHYMICIKCKKIKPYNDLLL